jgi:predicted transcriptional regulator
MAKPRRSRMDIIHDMLAAIQRKGGLIKPTHLMYKANLSHQLMKEYVDELMEKGFMDEGIDEKKKVYVLTEKGNEYLAQYRKMKEFQDAFGL